MSSNNELNCYCASEILKKMENEGKVKHLPCSSSISLSSNDYLGLAHNTKVIDASIKAVRKFGTSASGSRYLSGNHELNEKLERQIANFKSGKNGYARIFSSGYHANLSVMSVFGMSAGTIYSDSENHASIIDGLRLLKKPIHIYPHCDWEWVEKHIKQSHAIHPMIVTESLFSMRGDFGPLPELYRIAQKENGLLIIDDAHATGTIGLRGRGGLEFYNLSFDPSHMIITGTFSKALGSLGGFAIMNEKNRILLSSLAKAFIYTTALPPSVLAASSSSLEILEKSNKLTQNLKQLSSNWRKILLESTSDSPIISLKGPPSQLIKESSELLSLGFSLPVLVHPTVPEGQEQLRLSVNLLWNQNVENALMKTFSKRMGKS